MRIRHNVLRGRSAFIFLASWVLLSGCGDGGTGPGKPDDPGDNPVVSTEIATVTVGTAGGSVLLPDGSGVVFPAGALSSSIPITVKRVASTTFFDPNGAVQRVLISATASVSQFSQNVEVRVPLPAGTTPADTAKILAGVINEEDGSVTVEKSTIKIIDGKPFLVVSTNHFTTRVFEWLFGQTPPASALLTVPYYNQGSSNYCWAASLHMVTQAASFGEFRLLADIVGTVGVDEDGISSVAFRMSSAVASLVKDRTGVRPDRKMWDYVNATQMRDYLWQEVGVNGHPVALFSSKWEHAVVVVGYDVSAFRIHDPASTSPGSIGYTVKNWSEFVDGMAINDKLVTLVVPSAQGNSVGQLAINFLPGAMEFINPASGAGDLSSAYRFGWDYLQPVGYSFRHTTEGGVGNPLPGGVTKLRTRGEIQIANSSRTESRDVSVYLDITAMGAPTGVGRLSTHQDVTVGPNATVNLSVPDIQVDTFRYNAENPTEYVLTVSALTGGTTVDRQSIIFKIASITPELTAVVPGSGAVGDQVKLKGAKLGLTAYNNTVTFNKVKVDSIVSWEDNEITLVVPPNATTGPVIVTRGEVKSNPVEFTVVDYRTLTVSMSRFYPTEFGDSVTVSTSGTWSVTGVGALLARGPDELFHYGFTTKKDEATQLAFSFSGGPSRGGHTTAGGSVEYGELVWHFDASSYGTAFDVEESGTGGERSYTLTMVSYDNLFCVRAYFGLLADYFDKDGILTEHTTVNESSQGVFCVEPGN